MTDGREGIMGASLPTVPTVMLCKVEYYAILVSGLEGEGREDGG